MASPGSIGVGMVGYGLAGRLFHAPYIDVVDGLRLAVIATSNPDRRAQAAAEHPGATVVATVDDLLESGDVEMVVVVTPNRFHVPIGIRALEAGRHVVVDKPIAMDVPEAETLLEAADRSGRILSVYQNRRGDGDFLTVRSLLAAGTLGEIDSLEARFERWGVVGDAVARGRRGGRRPASRSRGASRGPEPGPVRRGSPGVRPDGPAPARQPGGGFDLRRDRSRRRRAVAALDVVDRRANRPAVPDPRSRRRVRQGGPRSPGGPAPRGPAPGRSRVRRGPARAMGPHLRE